MTETDVTGTRVDRPASAERLSGQLERLAGFTAPGEGVTRTSLTDSYMAALGFLEGLARDLSLSVSYDAVGNFYATNAAPGTPSVAIGSHVDSVPHGGRFDGTAGVLCAFEVARALPGVPITVVSFIGEEGSRFPWGLLGSRCVAGQVGAADLRRLKDESGTSFFDAARQRGFHPENVARCPDVLHTWSAYLEIHIEQGRVLQDEGLEIGLVTDIAGIVHATMSVFGRADHAGATPMHLRSDAALTAAEITLELEAIVRSASPTAVGTVGTLELSPGARNVIPGAASVGLDIRDRRSEVLDDVIAKLQTFAGRRAGVRRQRVSYDEALRTEPTALDPAVVDALEAALRRLHIPYRRMVSGAGHDAMLIAAFVPAGMLFVPCRDGVSHAPDEHADAHHLAAAVAVAAEYLLHRQDTSRAAVAHAQKEST